MSEFLEIHGAKTHNLKEIDVKIPKNKMVVLTGISGSGKTSLAFNTIYNVGQQKYLDSLSSYARMFIGKFSEEAEVEEITGLSPTISIDQKTTNRNPRSTVGTITEIYDYYKLLYLHIGERFCIKCGNLIKKDSLKQIIGEITEFDDDVKFMIKAEIFKEKNDLTKEMIKKEILDAGFIRFSLNDENYTINDDFKIKKGEVYSVDAIVDRLIVGDHETGNEDNLNRLKDSLNIAFKTGNGFIKIDFITKNGVIQKKYSDKFVCSKCGHVPEKIDISSFSFNNHKGACKDCHGLGVQNIFLEDNIINQDLSIEEGAIKVNGFGSYYMTLLCEVGKKCKIKTNIPYKDLTDKEKNIILNGTGNELYTVQFKREGLPANTYKLKFEGVLNTLNRRYFDGKGAFDGRYDDFLSEIPCPTCNGYKLNPESLFVKINSLNIGELSDLSVRDSLKFFSKLELTESQKITSKNVLKNIIERLEFLSGVGLEYMTISRKANTLSGGESQRIRLATQIGVKLEGIIYVLDEPSIGLHPIDNDMLINNLKKLRDIGNTLIIVEHDEDIMKCSDYIIDMGPGAGIHGGKIVSTGTFDGIIKDKNSITGPYLSGKKSIQISRKPRKQEKFLKIYGASHNNLKNIDVSFPVSNLTVVTGVSGSGKSSLVNDILANFLLNKLNRASRTCGRFEKIEGLSNFDKALVIDQSPIGKTPRSNPATYTGVFTLIRELFGMTNDAKIRGYSQRNFSFNTKEGRCHACEGEGVRKIEMHFLPPVYVECEQCEGKKFNPETLSIKFKSKNIAEVLDMTVEEAIDFFQNHKKILKILNVLNDVGLGYIKLGQSSLTLSGGEAQRIKLATELSKRSTSKSIFVLDEPTTGLHFADVEKLLIILHKLVDKGNTVIVIEHNINVILNSDYIVDIGPYGGDRGGQLIYEGDLKGIVKCKQSYTGQAINKYLEDKNQTLTTSSRKNQ